MKRLNKSDIQFIEKNNIFILSPFKKEFVRYYDLVDSSGYYSGYYLAILDFNINNDTCEYKWCRDFPEVNSGYIISFEEVMDNVNLEIKESLLFHLDIFS